MKAIVVLALLVLAVSVNADKTAFMSKLTSLTNMKAKAVDAVESALNLLKDLK